MEMNILHIILILLGIYMYLQQQLIILMLCKIRIEDIYDCASFFINRMPAFNDSMLYVIFFLAYLLVNLYLFMNLLLAVIFSNYKQHLQVNKIFLFFFLNYKLLHIGRKTINS